LRQSYPSGGGTRVETIKELSRHDLDTASEASGASLSTGLSHVGTPPTIRDLNLEEEGSLKLDRWGFVISENFDDDRFPAPHFDAIVRARLTSTTREEAAEENKRLVVWQRMLRSKRVWSVWQLSPQRSILRRRVRSGIPDAVRARVWMSFAGLDGGTEPGGVALPDVTEVSTLSSACPASTREIISRDIARTFPEHALFRDGAGNLTSRLDGGANGTSQSVGQEQLERVLCAYAAFDPEVGYCQGMSYLAAVLLMYAPDGEALRLLAAMLHRCGMRDMFLPGMPGFLSASQAFEGLIALRLPRLHAHLCEEGASSCVPYASRWFLTCFLGCLPFDASLRALDCLFFDRDCKVLHRLGVAILEHHENKLLRIRNDALLKELGRVASQCLQVQALFTAAYKIRIRRSTIRRLGLCTAGGAGAAAHAVTP